MPFCPKCGVKVPEGDNFCEDCGARLGRSRMNGSMEALSSVDIVPGTSAEPDIASKTGTATMAGARPEADTPPVTEAVADTKEYGRYGPRAFPKQVLTEGEVPLLETRPLLWIRVMGPILLVLFAVAVLVLAYLSFEAGWILYGLGVVLLLGAPWVLGIWIQWKYTLYAATNRRVLCQTGVISKSYVDCPLGKVQTVYLEIPVFGRMNNFGTLRIATAGEARVEIEWRNVKEPMKTQRILNEIIDKYARGAS